MKNRRNRMVKHVGPIMMMLVLYAPQNFSPILFDTYGSRSSIVLVQAYEDSAGPNKIDGSEKNNHADSSAGKPSDRQAPPDGQPPPHEQRKTHEDFSPSERIEVDQAVDFPADI